jgi:hypothetical protein
MLVGACVMIGFFSPLGRRHTTKTTTAVVEGSSCTDTHKNCGNRKSNNLQFDGFVPVDDVTRQTEAFDVDNVDVATFRADVQPLALERQVETSNPKKQEREISETSEKSSKFESISR